MLWLLQKPSSPAICTEQIIPSIFRIRNGRVLPRWRGTRVACLTALLGMGGQVTCLNITKKGKEEESPGESAGSWTPGVQCHQRWPQVHRTSAQVEPVIPKLGSAPPFSHSAFPGTIWEAPGCTLSSY